LIYALLKTWSGMPKKIEEARAAISQRASELQTQEVCDEQLALMVGMFVLNRLPS